MFDFDRARWILPFLLGKNEYLVFFKFSESLLTVNYWYINIYMQINWLVSIWWGPLVVNGLTIRKKTLISVLEWNGMVFSANMIGSNRYEVNWKSFMTLILIPAKHRTSLSQNGFFFMIYLNIIFSLSFLSNHLRFVPPVPVISIF